MHDLAAASEREVLRLWQDLGYYSRARNLHAAARQVVGSTAGVFPTTPPCAPSGVGDYTAAAVASIAFGLPEPVVDGNVYRVLACVFGVADPIDGTAGRRTFRELAARLLDPADPAPPQPGRRRSWAPWSAPPRNSTSACPLAARCIARKQDRIAELPVKQGPARVRDRWFHYVWVEQEGGIFIRERPAGDIWQGPLGTPLMRGHPPARHPRHGHRPTGTSPDPPLEAPRPLHEVRHVLSHQHLHPASGPPKPPRDCARRRTGSWSR